MNINWFKTKMLDFLKDPVKRFDYLSIMGMHNYMSDEKFLKKMYKLYTKKDLNLDDPKTFNEKLQWLKLYNRKPEYSTMVDKYEVKHYVADKIGSEHVIPLLAIWERSEDVNFDELPEQFVIKCTHDSASYSICKDRNTFDFDAAISKIKRRINKNFFWNGREWPYKNVKPRIIAEKYMEDSNGDSLTDYKFFCFNGEPKFMYISQETVNDCADYYDMDFNQIDLQLNRTIPASGIERTKPECFEEMKKYATILSENIPHVRVDFYYINGIVYFGEMTFFHNGGMTKFNTEEWNRTLGDWIVLPEKTF